MDMHVGNYRRFLVACEDANNKVTIAAKRIVTGLLFVCEIPRDIKPMGIASGEENPAGAVGLRQFCSAGLRKWAHGLRSEGVTGTWTASGRRRWLVAL